MAVAIDLVYLEGQTQDESANQLGWSKSTLRRRLEEARDALGLRLKERGISLPAALSAVLLSDCLTSAALGAGLVFSTVEAAAVAAAGKPAAMAASARVAGLAEGVLKEMLFTKLKIAAAAMVLATVVAAIATGLTSRPAVGQEVKLPTAEKPTDALPKQTAASPSAPKPANPGRILFFQQGTNKLSTINPEGKEQNTLSLDAPGDTGVTGVASFSPDGKQIALLGVTYRDGTPSTKLYVHTVGKDAPPIDLEVYCTTFAWSPDGSQLAVSDFNTSTSPDEKFEATHAFVNLKTKKQMPLPLPSGQFILDWSRDGKHLLTEQRAVNGKPAGNRLFLMNLDGTEVKAVTSGQASFFNGRLSPDGLRLLALGFTGSKPGTLSRAIPVVFELATGKMSEIPGVSENAMAESCCWSPDGKRIAYSWKELPEGKINDDGYFSKETQAHLTVCEMDGSNPRKIASAKGKGPTFVIFGCIDWR